MVDLKKEIEEELNRTITRGKSGHEVGEAYRQGQIDTLKWVLMLIRINSSQPEVR